MNTLQKSYAAFMESVCNQFNCREAFPPLLKGLEALCEANDVDGSQSNVNRYIIPASVVEQTNQMINANGWNLEPFERKVYVDKWNSPETTTEVVGYATDLNVGDEMFNDIESYFATLGYYFTKYNGKTIFAPEPTCNELVWQTNSYIAPYKCRQE